MNEFHVPEYLQLFPDKPVPDYRNETLSGSHSMLQDAVIVAWRRPGGAALVALYEGIKGQLIVYERVPMKERTLAEVATRVFVDYDLQLDRGRDIGRLEEQYKLVQERLDEMSEWLDDNQPDP